jgi:hypothetical protein
LKGLVGNIKGVGVDSRRREGREREEKKKQWTSMQTRNTFGQP